MTKDNNVHIKENLILGYETSIQLMIYEGGLVWTRFNTILTAHLVLIGVIGLILTLNTDKNSFSLSILSFSGIILSILWFVMTSRGFTYLEYLTRSAREYEEKIDSKSLVTLKRGYDFIKNKPVTFKLPKPLSAYQRPWYSKLFWSIKTEYASYGTIVAIGIIYSFLFFFTWKEFFVGLLFSC